MNQETLKKVFGDCRRLETSKCTIATSYELVSLSKFFIIDEKDEEPVRVLLEKGNSQLEVINKNAEDICVIKTDKCLFTDEHKKCDCILFSKNKIYLVEISTAKKRNSKRGVAVKQLSTTITLLKNNSINLDNHDTKAVICFKSGESRPTKASLNTQRAVFLEEHKISLEEGNEIVF